MNLSILHPHARDLGGGFHVRRLLPSPARQAVGPFVFFDHFGPVEAGPGDNHDVRPHPHIGLATVTYLFEGAMMHRDSTGAAQRIEPGAVNWMTAGSGIVHSERVPDDLRDLPRRTHGLQLWAALPAGREEDAAGFSHTPASAIPWSRQDGAVVRMLIGEAFGLVSPVPTLSATLYADLTLEPGASLALPAAAPERALYAIDRAWRLDGEPVDAATMVLVPEGATPRIEAPGGVRLMLIGGAPLGHRFMWWNFVSSRKERIAQAAQDWAERRFAPVPGETEFIPLPDRRP